MIKIKKFVVNPLGENSFIISDETGECIFVDPGYFYDEEHVEVKASDHEKIESSLQLEKWMTNDAIWNTNTAKFAELVQESETALEIENWMTNSETWNSKTNFVEETETGMSLENWMMNEKIWDLDAMISDTELEVESWMTDNNIWK